MYEAERLVMAANNHELVTRRDTEVLARIGGDDDLTFFVHRCGVINLVRVHSKKCITFLTYRTRTERRCQIRQNMPAARTGRHGLLTRFARKYPRPRLSRFCSSWSHKHACGSDPYEKTARRCCFFVWVRPLGLEPRTPEV